MRGEERVYTPPNFIKIPNRNPMLNLAWFFDRLPSDLHIVAIVDLESVFNPRVPMDDSLLKRRESWLTHKPEEQSP